MPKLKDSQLAANVRNRNKEATRRMRERHQAMGNVTISVWVSAEAKAKAEELARVKGVSLGEVVDLALVDLALNKLETAA